ncbi:MAG: fructose-bisphosphate aldolase class I, partial [Alphaproteobacteria bacterium]|nr:fructose-bisphosphate aldolase class I [Alphaproteobacteria bacterium]
MSLENLSSLEDVAQALVATGKGILAADESGGTIKKRFDTINVESTETSRRNYREFLFTAAAMEDFISGVILFDETLRQSSAAGERLADLLRAKGVIPGIKVDKGAKPLAGAEAELVTEGLDGLRERLAEYAALGAQFVKWRAVISIGGEQPHLLPSDYCIDANAHALARYAALSVEAGLVPIVEPEILMDGDHTIETSYAVTERVLTKVFETLALHRVAPTQMLLKPNMVISGYACASQADAARVASETVRCLKATVPAGVPGIVFLSGGQSEA